MTWELLVLVPLAAATLVAALSFVGCTPFRRTPIDIVLDPGRVEGITAVRFLVSLPGQPQVALGAWLSGTPARWVVDLPTAPSGDWRIACEVERSGRPLARTPEIVRRVPPTPVNLRLVGDGELRLEPPLPTLRMRLENRASEGRLAGARFTWRRPGQAADEMPQEVTTPTAGAYEHALEAEPGTWTVRCAALGVGDPPPEGQGTVVVAASDASFTFFLDRTPTGLTVGTGRPMPMPMRVPVTFALDTSGAGAAQVASVQWRELRPMPGTWMGSRAAPTQWVSPSIQHDQNVEIVVECRVQRGAGPGGTPPPDVVMATLPVGTTPVTFTFRLIEDRSTFPATYRVERPT